MDRTPPINLVVASRDLHRLVEQAAALWRTPEKALSELVLHLEFHPGQIGGTSVTVETTLIQPTEADGVIELYKSTEPSAVFEFQAFPETGPDRPLEFYQNCRDPVSFRVSFREFAQAVRSTSSLENLELKIPEFPENPENKTQVLLQSRTLKTGIPCRPAPFLDLSTLIWLDPQHLLEVGLMDFRNFLGDSIDREENCLLEIPESPEPFLLHKIGEHSVSTIPVALALEGNSGNSGNSGNPARIQVKISGTSLAFLHEILKAELQAERGRDPEGASILLEFRSKHPCLGVLTNNARALIPVRDSSEKPENWRRRPVFAKWFGDCGLQEIPETQEIQKNEVLLDFRIHDLHRDLTRILQVSQGSQDSHDSLQILADPEIPESLLLEVGATRIQVPNVKVHSRKSRKPRKPVQIALDRKTGTRFRNRLGILLHNSDSRAALQIHLRRKDAKTAGSMLLRKFPEIPGFRDLEENLQDMQDPGLQTPPDRHGYLLVPQSVEIKEN